MNPGAGGRMPGEARTEAEWQALLDAKRARAADLERQLAERAQQQAATADVLRAISRSPTDLQRVLDTIAESAARLCESETGIVFRLQNGAFRVDGGDGVSPALDELLKRAPAFVDRKTTTGRAALERRAIQIPDVLADPEYGRPDAQRTESYRSTLATPLPARRRGAPRLDALAQASCPV